VRDRLDRFVASALVLLPLIVFAPALLPGRTLSPAANLFTLYPWNALARGAVPANPALGDVTHVFHPWLIWAAREIHAGRFPFWNPHEYTGTPFFSNTVTALLFPPHWLALVLPVPLAITLVAALKLAVAGLAMYWFLRVLALHPLAALPGALGFMLSSTLIAWLHWPYGTTMIFLPLLFGVVERLRQGAGRGAVAALALTLGVDLVSGYPQGPLHGALAAGAWALVRARGAPRHFLPRCAAGALLGGGLAAVQLLPFWDYVRESAVYAYRIQWTLMLSVPPRAAVTFLMPWFFGVGRESWGPWQFGIVSTWFGIVPVLALPLACLVAWRRVATRFFAILLLVLLAMHYGAPGATTLAELPGLALGTNLRLMPLIGLALCALGALGLDAVARGEAIRPWVSRALRVWTLALVVAALAWVVVLGDEPGARALALPLSLQYLGLLALLGSGAVLLLGWLADPARHARCGWALTALQLASLLPIAATYNPVADARWLYPSTPAIAALQRASADRGRVLMPGNYGLLYGLDEAHGYDAMTPRRIAEVVGTVGTGVALGQGLAENPILLHGSEPLAPAAVLLSPALDLLGVRHVVMPPGAGAPRPDMTLEYDGRDARVWRNDRAFPRAFLVSRARCADDREALALVRGGSVDLRAEVVLADCAGASAPEAGGHGGVVDALGVSPDHLRFATLTDTPTYLVVTDTWFPGWRARVDGREAPLWRADYAFRAVRVPTGRHTVELVFRPRYLVAGLAISGLAGLVVVALITPWPRAGRRAAALGLAAVALAVAAPAAASAALPAPPFTLDVSPASVGPGQRAVVTVAPRGGASRSLFEGRGEPANPGSGQPGAFDVYLMWAGDERAAFLTRDGAWAPRPVAWRARITTGEGPIAAEWRVPGPMGAVRLALVVVPAGVDPLARQDWSFRPELVTLTVRGPSRGGGAPEDLWPILVATLLVCGIVAFYRRNSPFSPPPSVV